MRLVLALVLALAALPAGAQVYRWVDAKGVVHYSNEAPPPGVEARVLPIPAQAGVGVPGSIECYTVRCQGERLEQRLARREHAEARDYAERIAATPPRARGLDFRRYVSIERGMSEGELLVVAGEPDLLLYPSKYATAYTYLPTPADPFTTTITLLHGRVVDIERARRF